MRAAVLPASPSARVPPIVARPPRVPKPPPHVLNPPPASVPKPPPVGRLPRPRRPRLVRDTTGGYLGDLFALFPDLPWAPRPRERVLPRTLAKRMSMRQPQSVPRSHKFDAASRAR